MSDAFWIDSEYDREYSSDGVSRFGAYLRQAAFEPWTDNDDDQAVEFAVYAWDRGTTPVMAPGYVRRHRRILSVSLERNEWDGGLLATVDLITGLPGPLESLHGWRAWPTETMFASDSFRYLEPSGEDLAKAPYLLTSASLRFVVPTGDLPQPPALSRDLLATGKRSVSVLVTELNRVVNPVLDALEGS